MRNRNAMECAYKATRLYVMHNFPHVAAFFDRIWEASISESQTPSRSHGFTKKESRAIQFAGDDTILRIAEVVIPFVVGVVSSVMSQTAYRKITSKEQATTVVEDEARKLRIIMNLDEKSVFRLIPYIVGELPLDDHKAVSPTHLEDLLDDRLQGIYRQVHQDREISDLLIQIQNTHPNFTSHGIEHSQSIISNVERLLSREIWNEFTPIEILILLCGAWIHDVGMSDFDGEMAESDDESKRKEIRRLIRENHSKRSEKYITTPYNYQRLLLGPALADIIGAICRMHVNEYDLMKLKPRWGPVQGFEEYGEIRVRLLAALLRLSDACDLGYRRVREALITVYKIPRNYVESIPHIDGALLISGLVVRGRTLVVQATPTSDEQRSWVDFLTGLLEEDLRSVVNVLKDRDTNGIEIPLDEVKLETLETD